MINGNSKGYGGQGLGSSSARPKVIELSSWELIKPLYKFLIVPFPPVSHTVHMATVNFMMEVLPCDGLASLQREVEILLVASCN